MSWTDKASINHIKAIKDIFKVKTFIETGTFRGMNVLAHKDNFSWILSCEKEKKYFNIAEKKCKNYEYIHIYNTDSKEFLRWIVETLRNLSPFVYEKYNIFYLDAHFYDKNRPKGKGKFVVLDELKELKGFKEAIIIIHDFNNGLGHITYDGISLDMNLLRKDLLKVNPKFHFYTNELSSCDIITLEEAMLIHNQNDKDRYDNLVYTWSKPEKTYRGLLYCLPKKVKIKGLKEIK